MKKITKNFRNNNNSRKGNGMAGIVANIPMPIKEGKTIQNNDKLNYYE